MHLLRHSSKTREFFANLKKFYRSTKSELPMATNSRTCFVFDQDDLTKVLIQITYVIPSTNMRRQFNLLRSVDEPLSQTLRRLTANIDQVSKKVNKTKKVRLQQESSSGSSIVNPQTIVIQLLDQNDQPIDQNQTNRQVWINSRKLLINDVLYNIEYNAPAVIKFRFPDIVMSNTITTALVELDHGSREYSIFDWYVTDEVKSQNDENEQTDSQWTHVHRGPFCVFRDEHINKYVRLTCLPRNKSLREGMPAEHISKSRIIPSPADLPMLKRHQLTSNYFPVSSNYLRLVSYNILANGYATSSTAESTIYPYCPQDYLEQSYRKPLLLKEILGYNADLISLQECDTKFFERELSLVLNEYGYLGEMYIKSENVQEGEAIFYRKDRFTAIANHNVRIGEYLHKSEYTKALRERCALAPNVNAHLLERNTILQILALQLNANTNDIFLICNTHLYFRPTADVIRCFQTLIACERIREIKELYEKQKKNVCVIFNGDFNANLTSLAVHLLFTGYLLTDVNHRSYNADYEALIKDFDYKTPVEFSTYSNYEYTNFMLNFRAVIDHIFFDTKNFAFHRCIPMPTFEELSEFTALPSCKIPSDHLAVVLELEIIR